MIYFDEFEKITPDVFENIMEGIASSNDKELRHSHADDLMCEVLRQLGYEKGVEIFSDMERWYA